MDRQRHLGSVGQAELVPQIVGQHQGNEQHYQAPLVGVPRDPVVPVSQSSSYVPYAGAGNTEDQYAKHVGGTGFDPLNKRVRGAGDGGDGSQEFPLGWALIGLAGVVVGGGAILALSQVDKADKYFDRFERKSGWNRLNAFGQGPYDSFNYFGGPVVRLAGTPVAFAATPKGPVLAHDCTGRSCRHPIHSRFHTLAQHKRHSQ